MTNARQISDVAGCLVDNERKFLLDYASRQYTGEGEIVDLGCFLGSSTYAMALGLEQNAQVENKNKRVFAYDRFEWNEWMNRPASRYQLGQTFEENECFAAEFERQMGDKVKYINTVKADLTKTKWEHSSHIEYLFVDSMKNWKLCNSIIEGFYPAMKPGASFLHHQDYVFFQIHWIHLTMFRMRDYFESVDHEYMGPSKVFKYTKQLPAEMMSQTYSIDDFSTEEILDAFDYAKSVVRPGGYPAIVGAKIHALYEKQEIEKAEALMADAEAKHPLLTANPVFQNSVSRLAQRAKAA